MTAPHDGPSDDQAIYQRWLPVVEKAEAAFAAWLAANRLPGEGLEQAQFRYAETKPKPDLSRIAQALVRRRAPKPRLVWSRSLSAADLEVSDAIDRSAAKIVKD